MTQNSRKVHSRERTSPEEVLKQIEVHERGAATQTTFQQMSSGTSIKTEPAFAIEGRSDRGRKKQRGGFSGNRGGRGGRSGRSSKCDKCGQDWNPRHECPARGHECKLCKRKGHLESQCWNAKPQISSIEEESSQQSSSPQNPQPTEIPPQTQKKGKLAQISEVTLPQTSFPDLPPPQSEQQQVFKFIGEFDASDSESETVLAIEEVAVIDEIHAIDYVRKQKKTRKKKSTTSMNKDDDNNVKSLDLIIRTGNTFIKLF